jgi:hypothetical protein
MTRLAFVLICISSTAWGQQSAPVEADSFFAIVEATFVRSPQARLDFHNLRQQRKALLEDRDDFHTIFDAVGSAGVERDVLLSLQEVALRSALDVDNALNFIALYQGMVCDHDRSITKGVLQNRLELYSKQLNEDSRFTTQLLASSKSPGTVQLALRMRDELDSAKASIDVIATPLIYAGAGAESKK